MNTILKNLWSVFKRFKMATLLNVAGLAVAFSAFLVILMQVDYERSFDRCHPTSDRVFRVELQSSGGFSVILPRAFIEEVIVSSPHIEAGTLINPFLTPIYFTYMDNGDKHGFKEAIQTCHPEMMKVFDFPIIEGDPECLKEPEKIIIPESIARKLFGNQSAIGKQIRAEENIWSKEKTDHFTIGAVYRDFPDNTQLRNLIYAGIDPNFARTNFTASNYICYVLLDDLSNKQTVIDNFNSTFDFSNIGRPDESIKLTPVTSIYYLDESQDGRLFRSGNKDVSNLLILIAILILIVAIINYTNFSTALTPARIKSINTQKVMGSPDNYLRRALLFEAVLISMIAWLISLGLVWIIYAIKVLPFIHADLSFAAHSSVVLFSGFIAVAIGFIAGVYPAWYMVSFPPALVLKGSFGLSASGKKLRTVLIGVQFVVSILLIIGATMVRMQNDFMRSYTLGFDKDQIAIVELSGDLYDKSREAYTNRLKEFPGIEDVAFAMEKIASQDGYSTNSTTYKDKNFQYYMLGVSHNFLRVMGIPVIEGRDFTPADQKSENVSYIFNQVAHHSMEMEVGDPFGSWMSGHLVGFTGDVKFTSLRKSESNIALVTGDIPMSLKFSFIRLAAGTDVHAAVSHIRKTLAEIDPTYPFEVEFYDTLFNQLYHKEVNMRALITLFSVLAIMLSLVGVFGLVVFDTQYKRKEIAIRKVHGSTIGQILEMLNRQYIYIIIVCFIIAAPLAWYFVDRWLEGFAYKTPVYWWVFALAFGLIALITIATVTFQSWKTANENPVNSMKSE